MSVFGVFLIRIFPQLDWIQRDIDQKNSEYGYFSCSDAFKEKLYPYLLNRFNLTLPYPFLFLIAPINYCSSALNESVELLSDCHTGKIILLLIFLANFDWFCSKLIHFLWFIRTVVNICDKQKTTAASLTENNTKGVWRSTSLSWFLFFYEIFWSSYMELNWGDTATTFWGLQTYIVANFKKVSYF